MTKEGCPFNICMPADANNFMLSQWSHDAYIRLQWFPFYTCYTICDCIHILVIHVTAKRSFQYVWLRATILLQCSTQSDFILHIVVMHHYNTYVADMILQYKLSRWQSLSSFLMISFPVFFFSIIPYNSWHYILKNFILLLVHHALSHNGTSSTRNR